MHRVGEQGVQWVRGRLRRVGRVAGFLILLFRSCWLRLRSVFRFLVVGITVVRSGLLNQCRFGGFGVSALVARAGCSQQAQCEHACNSLSVLQLSLPVSSAAADCGNVERQCARPCVKRR